MQMDLIGHVAVDSGQLLVCDPCYIDSEWEKEDFEDVRIYKHKDTSDTLQYRKDFANYEQVIPKYNKTMNELNATGEWEEMCAHPVVHSFSYNACAKATLSHRGHGPLKFKMGHDGAGVAFRTAWGDGYYPVYAVYDDYGDLIKVEVVFQEDGFSEEDFEL